MKVLITELANEIMVSVNDLMVYQQSMNPDLYTGVGKRTWFTLEGVKTIKEHFSGPHVEASTLQGVVIGQCPNRWFVYATIAGQEGKVTVKIPKRYRGKLDKKRILVEKLVHGTEVSYQFVKA